MALSLLGTGDGELGTGDCGLKSGDWQGEERRRRKERRDRGGEEEEGREETGEEERGRSRHTCRGRAGGVGRIRRGRRKGKKRTK